MEGGTAPPCGLRLGFISTTLCPALARPRYAWPGGRRLLGCGGGDCREPGEMADGVARGLLLGLLLLLLPLPLAAAPARGRAAGVGRPPAGGLMKGAPGVVLGAGRLAEDGSGERMSLPLPPPSMLRRLRRAASEAGRLPASKVGVEEEECCGGARRPPLPLRAGLGPPRCLLRVVG